MNHSTAGLSASAKKIETKIHESTWLVTARIVKSAHAAITSPMTVITERTLNRTTRSSRTSRRIATPPDGLHVGFPHVKRNHPHQSRRDRDRALPGRGAQDGRELHHPCGQGVLRRRHLPPHHPGLHGPGRRPDRH